MMKVDLKVIKPKTLFFTRDKQKCTLLKSVFHCDTMKMPIFKVKFIMSNGTRGQALYYQNGTMFDVRYNCWDIISTITPLLLDSEQTNVFYTEPDIKTKRKNDTTPSEFDKRYKHYLIIDAMEE